MSIWTRLLIPASSQRDFASFSMIEDVSRAVILILGKASASLTSSSPPPAPITRMDASARIDRLIRMADNVCKISYPGTFLVIVAWICLDF
ncbi:hypothetical protein NDM98_02410 [Shouchella plakortidis]|uniref:Uncharacterized protein n=1 Tax=Alkalicoccobacillus plakortidis TaxID=444060 RepID=A0ABT0XF19_9BACI|nr:hypothetical protein [Alkalicoccobacillus plakortidis]MCM2674477.1 hypothetical protein [Alkalicoccobacillus plakortidis]